MIFFDNLKRKLLPSAAMCYCEILRFMRVFQQTIVTPVISSLTWCALFGFSLSLTQADFSLVNYCLYTIPCLGIVTACQGSFANTISSLVIAKMQKYFTDFLVVPVGGFGFLNAMVLASFVRSFIVLVLFIIITKIITGMTIFGIYYWRLFFLIFLSSGIMAILGIMIGCYIVNIEQMAVPTYVINTILLFSTTTFYSVHDMPDTLVKIASFFPFIHMTEVIKYCVSCEISRFNVDYSIFVIFTWFALLYLMYIKFGTKDHIIRYRSI